MDKWCGKKLDYTFWVRNVKNKHIAYFVRDIGTLKWRHVPHNSLKTRLQMQQVIRQADRTL